jgi:hypothetical protein
MMFEKRLPEVIVKTAMVKIYEAVVSVIGSY